MEKNTYTRLIILITLLVVLLLFCGCPGLVSSQIQIGDKNAKVNVPMGWINQITDEQIGQAKASKVLLSKSGGSQISIYVIKSSDATLVLNSIDISGKAEQKIVATQKLINKTVLDPTKLTLQSISAGSGMLNYAIVVDSTTGKTNVYGIGDSGSCFVIISGAYPATSQKDVDFLLSKVDLY